MQESYLKMFLKCFCLKRFLKCFVQGEMKFFCKGENIKCRTVCLTDPSNDQLVKGEGAQIFYSIRSQTKPIGIGANCEIPHNAAPTTRTYDLGSDTTCRTVCLTDPSNDQLVKDEGAQIFYSI